MGTGEPGLTAWNDPLARMREALEHDEFVLYVQPIRPLHEAQDGVFAEVLVRLREEEKALLPPGEFLPAFEYYQMMPQLDRWVMRQAARTLARGSHLRRLSMNVSGQTLAQGSFAEYFADEVRAAKVDPAAFLFEIDEHDLLERAPMAERFAAEMARVGARVVVDGFGQRAISFAPVKALRPACVKVDGSITRRVVSDEAAAVKLCAIVKVCLTLGAPVIAECVEEQDVLARLKLLGAGYAQGFGIARPMPIEDFATELSVPVAA